MNIRFADILSKTDDSASAEMRQDFVIRKRRPMWQALVMLFISILPLSIILSTIAEDRIIFAVILFVLLTSLGSYVIVVMQRCRDLVLATEFQNALLASAIGHGNAFCMIVKDDNNITYMNRALQEILPSFHKEKRRAIDVFLEHAKVSKEERKTIFAALESRIRGKIIFNLTDSENNPHRIVMSLEPIARPKGFMLLRGREFVEKRVAGLETGQNNTPLFNRGNTAMFSYLTDSMNIGAYIIDTNGKITYANETLEQWLDFDEGKLTNGENFLKNIISQTHSDIPAEELKDFDGEVFLQRKTGGNIKASLTQKSLYDNEGKLIGYGTIIRQIRKEQQADNNW